MGATSNEGTGLGSVYRNYPKIVNDVVKGENLSPLVFKNFEGTFELVSTNEVIISTADGTAENEDAGGITMQAGSGYPLAPDGIDADGGGIFIYAGQANGDGEGGNIEIFAGNTGDGPDANAGIVHIQGGNADAADNSDAGNVRIYGGDASTGIGDSDGGDVDIRGGNSGDDGQAGWVYIYAGNSGSGDGSENSPQAGSVEIFAGNSNANTDTNGGDITINSGSGTVNGRGGDLTLNTGNSVGTDRAGDMFLTCGTNSGAGRNGHIYLNSMPRMPVYANSSARDEAAGIPTEGMFCYNSNTGNIEVYVGGAWKSVDVSPIV